MRKTILMSAVCGSLGIAFGIYSSLTAMRIQSQKVQIEKQAEILAHNQAVYLTQQALDLYQQDNRVEAVDVAYQAMTTYEGVKMPDTPEAETTLAKVLSVYDGSATICGAMQFEMPGVLKDMKASEDGSYALASDALGNLICWDMVNKTKVKEMSEKHEVFDFDFMDDNTFFYLTAEEGIKKISISDGKEQTYQKEDALGISMMMGAVISPDKKYLLVQDLNSVDIVLADTMERVATYAGKQGSFTNRMYISDQSDKAFIIYMQNEEAYLTSFDLLTGEEGYQVKLAETDIFDAYSVNNTLYIVGCKSQELFTGQTTLAAVDQSSGELLYTQIYEDIMATKLSFSENGNMSNLLLMSGTQAIMVDAKSGEKKQTYLISEKVAYALTDGEGGFILYTENGMSHMIHAQAPYTDMAMQTIVCEKVVKFARSAAGLLGMKDNDNRVVVYCYLQNKDASVYTGEMKEPLAKAVLGDEAIAWCEENKVEKATFVDGYLPMKDANLVLVSYVDHSLAMYRADTMELLSTYKDTANGIYEDYGKVGPYYVAVGGYTGYLFDEQGQMHSTVPDMKGVARDADSVVVFGKDNDRNSADIAIPIYTKEKLLEKTKGYLEKMKP